MPFHFILPEDPPTFSVFIRAVLHQWVVLTSGCGLTVLIGVFEKISGTNISYPFYIGVLILFVFVACFLAWIDAREEMNKLGLELAKKQQQLLDKDGIVLDTNRTVAELRQELLEEKEKRTPHLEAVIKMLIAGQTVVAGVKHTAVTLEISVSNIGMASVAVNWEPAMSVMGKQPLSFQYFHVSNELTLSYGNEQNAMVISGKDMIYEKTAIPIQTGNIVTGYLHFRVPFEMSEVMAQSTSIKVFFNDVIGKVYEVTYEKDKAFDLPHPSHTAGVKTKIITTDKNRKPRHKNR